MSKNNRLSYLISISSFLVLCDISTESIKCWWSSILSKILSIRKSTTHRKSCTIRTTTSSASIGTFQNIADFLLIDKQKQNRTFYSYLDWWSYWILWKSEKSLASSIGSSNASSRFIKIFQGSTNIYPSNTPFPI